MERFEAWATKTPERRRLFQKSLGIVAVFISILSIIVSGNNDGTFALLFCPFGLYMFFTKEDVLNIPDYTKDDSFEYDWEDC